MKRTPKTTTTEEEETDAIIETVPRRTEFDCILEDYLEEANERDTIPKLTLYKYDSDAASRSLEKEFIGYFTGADIPNKHKIGLMFGGGKYQAFFNQPKKKDKELEQQSVVFRIGKIYDQHKRQHEEEQRRVDVQRFGGPPAGAIETARPVNTAAESFVMVKELLSMLTPIMKAQATAAANAPPPAAPAPDLMSQYAMMQKILQKNLFDTADTYRNFARRFNEIDQEPQSVEQDETDKPEEPGLMSYVEKIIKMVEPFFGLIAQKGAAAQVTAQTVRSAPQFAELLSDPQLCRLVIQYFDKTKGTEAANLALKNLGINRASLFAAGHPGNGGQTANQSAAAKPPASAQGRPPKQNARQPAPAITAKA